MTKAEKNDIIYLRKQYGVEAVPTIACQQNALIAALRIFETDPTEFPRIYQVEFPDQNDFHAYLVHKGIVYNEEVTITRLDQYYKNYPDFDLNQLQAIGQDITIDLLTISLASLVSTEEGLDTLNFGPILRIFFPNIDILKALLLAGYMNVTGTAPEDYPQIFS